MKTFLKPLTSAEEKLCLKRCRKGDPEAKRILIEHNLRLVAHVAKKYQNTGEDLEDLISIGTIGLIKAVSTFDGNRNSRLGTYAARCIENTIHTQRHFWRLILQKCLFVCREKTGFFPENTIY